MSDQCIKLRLLWIIASRFELNFARETVNGLSVGQLVIGLFLTGCVTDYRSETVILKYKLFLCFTTNKSVFYTDIPGGLSVSWAFRN